jgi:hypothetical protein
MAGLTAAWQRWNERMGSCDRLVPLDTYILFIVHDYATKSVLIQSCWVDEIEKLMIH